MRIYVAHSSGFDFKKELYAPLRNSELNDQHEITLPHEESGEQYNSKDYLKNCDLVIAEVSYPSTGQGIELGWANLYNVQIFCIYKLGTKPSAALKVVSDIFLEYKNPEGMLRKIKKQISIMHDSQK